MASTNCRSERLVVLFYVVLCAALGTQLWMSEVSLHLSISAACEYSIIRFNHFLWLFPHFWIFSIWFHHQGSCIHVEQVKPAERWRSEFSYAAGACIWPHPACPGWATPCSPGQTPVWSHSNCQAVYGGTGPWQHSNRRPDEPPTSLETRDSRKEKEIAKTSLPESEEEQVNKHCYWRRYGVKERQNISPLFCPVLVCHSAKTWSGSLKGIGGFKVVSSSSI